MKKERWSTSTTSVYNLGYHIIWCPKFRRKVLTGETATVLKDALNKRATENGWSIENLEVMPDHVHMFIKAGPTDAVSYIVAQLKGYSSHKLRQKFPSLWKRLPSLWTRSYYAESVGCMSEDAIKRYIENQKRNSSHG